MCEKIKSIKIHRNELYKQVWKIPISKLAAKYNLSDVGLAKICDKLKVPRPPRGYWTKLQFGKKVVRPSLTALDSNERDVYEIYVMPKEKKELRKGDAKIENVFSGKKSRKAVNVSKRLMSPHPLVNKIKQFLLKQKVDDYGIVRSWRSGSLDVRVSPKSLNRALRIMGRIIKALESFGNRGSVGEIEAHSHSGTYVEIRGEKVSFYIKEKIQRIDHIPTEEKISSARLVPLNFKG